MPNSVLSKRLSAAYLLVIVCFALVDCGGGGGGGGGSSGPTVSGTAASGTPIAGATVTLKDASGTSRTATTASNGTFSIGAIGLTPPFFIQVAGGAGNLYSVSADAGTTTTINVTPLTDLIIRSWYNVQAVSIDAVFGGSIPNPPPSPAQVQIIGAVVQNVVQLWLNQAGVSASNFNLISTPFAADGSGVDLVLHRTTVNPATGAIAITDGTTTQNTSLTTDANTGVITAATTTTGASNTSTSTVSTVIPVLSAQQQALDDIAALLGNFATTANAKGAFLVGSDLTQYFDTGLLRWGFDSTHYAERLAEFLAGQTISFKVKEIKSLDTVGNVADLVVQIFLTADTQGQFQTLELFFKKVNGAWLVSGDGGIAEVDISSSMVVGQGGIGSGPRVTVDVIAPLGTITAATVIGGPFSSATALTIHAVPDASNAGSLDHFSLDSATLMSALPPGTSFTVVATKAAGGTATFTVPNNAFTNDGVTFTTNFGAATLANAHLGSTLTASWILPKTFPIALVHLEVLVTSAAADCEIYALNLSASSTTGTISVPTTCGNQPATKVGIDVDITGVNGEDTFTGFTFQ